MYIYLDYTKWKKGEYGLFKLLNISYKLKMKKINNIPIKYKDYFWDTEFNKLDMKLYN